MELFSGNILGILAFIIYLPEDGGGRDVSHRKALYGKCTYWASIYENISCNANADKVFVHVWNYLFACYDYKHKLKLSLFERSKLILNF